MFLVKSQNLELRGIANKESSKGNVYYIINVEGEDGTPYGFYAPKADVFPQGLKKGDTVAILFEVTWYKNQERLVVKEVAKVEV